MVGDERAKNDTVDLEQPDDINYEEFCEEWLSEFRNEVDPEFGTGG